MGSIPHNTSIESLSGDSVAEDVLKALSGNAVVGGVIKSFSRHYVAEEVLKFPSGDTIEQVECAV